MSRNWNNINNGIYYFVFYIYHVIAMNVAFIIDGSDSITGQPNGGQWRIVKQWVWNIISDLELEARPGLSYAGVMQVKVLP